MVDLACGVLLAAIAMTIAAGIGVVGVGALIALLVVLAWVGVEALLARMRRHSTTRN